MTIQIDSREKARAITKIIATFDKAGVQYFTSKLPVGDYQSLDNPRLVLDRKQSLSELCGNVCQQHKRFSAELERSNTYGIKLIVLCEHGKNITCLNDVIGWVNPRLSQSPLAMSGERLFKVLFAIGKTYNVDFVFCTKANTGREIIRLLGGNT